MEMVKRKKQVHLNFMRDPSRQKSCFFEGNHKDHSTQTIYESKKIDPVRNKSEVITLKMTYVLRTSCQQKRNS